MDGKRFVSAAIAVGIAFVLCVCSAAAAPQSNRPTTEEQLAKVEQDWADSYVKRDPLFAQGITTADFTFVDPDGLLMNKADYLKSITGETIVSAFNLEQLKVRVHGDAAVVTGVAIITAKKGEKDKSGKYAFTDLFIKQNGEWKAVSGQATAMAKP
jgi:ketosteroid isomerase-like protein